MSSKWNHPLRKGIYMEKGVNNELDQSLCKEVGSKEELAGQSVKGVVEKK